MLPCPLSNIQLEQQAVSANTYFPSIFQMDKIFYVSQIIFVPKAGF